MKPQFPIRYKILFVTTLLLAIFVGVYLSLAIQTLKEDKTKLVYDYNRSMVINIASDVETLFQGIADKLKLAALFCKEKSERCQELMRTLLAEGNETVFVGSSESFKKVDRSLFVNKTYMETYGLKEEFYLTDLPHQRTIPFDRLRTEGEAIWNATIKNGPPLIGFGRRVVQETEMGIPIKQYLIISYLRADKLVAAIKYGKFNETFITNKKGELLVHSQMDLMSKRMEPDTLVRKAMSHPMRTSVLPIQIDGQKFLGAFSKSFHKRILVFSRVSEDKVFVVIQQLIYKTFFFAITVFTGGIIVVVLFSRSLTRPLEELIDSMKYVSKGVLEKQITVSTRDEIAILADSFNHMIRDLKQSREELEEVNSQLENKVKARTHQLEKQNQYIKKVQETLLRTNHLAAMGEMAGRAAHEVLNPLTSIVSRIQKVQSRLEQRKEDDFQFLKEILQSWKRDYDEESFNGLVKNWGQPSQVIEGISLFEEDLKNINLVSDSFTLEMDTLSKDIKFLLGECQRISHIVSSMLSLYTAKGESRLYDVEHLVKESMYIMADWAAEMHTEIVMEEKEKGLMVLVNRDEFLQSITNLLRNSIQAIRTRAKKYQKGSQQEYKGKVDISIQKERNKVLIGVKDNGEGIEKKNRNKLFDPQFSGKTRKEGTGLGLSISRRFIRAFDGDIRLGSSTVGKGTIFVVELPLASSPTEEGVSA